MPKSRFLSFVLAVVAFVVISQVVHIAGSFLTMGYYLDPAYLSVWSPLMMPTAGPPPQSFFLYSLLFSLISGLAIVWGFKIVRPSLGAHGPFGTALRFAGLLFLLSVLPSTLSMILLINLPLVLVLEWAVELLLVYYLSALVFVKWVF